MPPKKTETTAAAAGSSLSREDIERLIDLIYQKNIEEFELEQGSTRLRIVSNRPTYVAAPVAMPAAVAHAPAPQPVAAPAKEVAATSATPNAPVPDDPRLKKITSPMVGTFYRSASPGSKAFVEVGDQVDQDTVLCIIEAMKLMNEIKAETRGVVKKILVENAQPVEYGQSLFLVDPL